MFRKVFKKIFSKHQPVKLGRWDLKHDNNSSINISAVLNAADHCGDQICGNPIIVNELIQNKKYNSPITDDNYCCMLLGLNSCNNCILSKNIIKHKN